MTGLYVHVPFCVRACPYCDFDFQVGSNPPVDAYLDGLRREVDPRRSEFENVEVRTVYVGGGTPSALGTSGLRELTQWIRSSLAPGPLDEFTLEVNPEQVTPDLVDTVRAAGVDRISIGIQSLDLDGLRQLGRVHSVSQALDAVEWSRTLGLRTSGDLIVGWPGQSHMSVAREVGGLLEAGIDHVSVYALTIEPDTPWTGLVRRGRRGMPDPDHQAECLLAAEQALEDAGFVHYEVASYARPGNHARHNSGTWTWSDYIGIGPSAHSGHYDDQGTVRRRSNQRGFTRWLLDPSRAAEIETLGGERAAREGLWLGLRRLQGMDVEAFLSRFPTIDRTWLETTVARAVQRGLLAWHDAGRSLAVAPGRWMVLDAICADLIGP